VVVLDLTVDTVLEQTAICATGMAALSAVYREQMMYQQQQDQARQREEERAAAQAAQANSVARQQLQERQEDARREAQQRSADAQAQLYQRRASVQAAVAQVAAYNRLTNEERSLENKCRQPDVARLLLDRWSDIDTFKNNKIRAIDI